MRPPTHYLPALLRATHPGPSVAVTAIAVALAVGVGRGLAGALVTGAAVLTGQLVIGWTNDLVDRSRDVAAGRTDKPLARGEVAPAVVVRAIVLAGALCVPLSFASGAASGAVHLALVVGSGLLYDLRLKSSVWSWLPFAVAFGALPAVVTLGLPGAPWPAGWVIAAGALLGVGAHLLNALPDLPDDVAAGVRGLPHRLGPALTRVAAAGCVLAALTAAVLGPSGTPGPGGWLLLAAGAAATGAAVGAVRDPASRAPFVSIVVVAVAAVGLLVAQGPRWLG